MSIQTVIASKTVEDLKEILTPAAVESKGPSDQQVNDALRALKFQNGCSETDANLGWIGLGDIAICSKVGISLEQLKAIREARDAKLTELTVKDTPLVEKPEL